jgi:hypothetical protein
MLTDELFYLFKWICFHNDSYSNVHAVRGIKSVIFTARVTWIIFLFADISIIPAKLIYPTPAILGTILETVLS